MELTVARVDVLTTRIYHLRGRARVQVYSGRGKGPLTVDVQTVRQVVDARGHETTEAYVSDGPAGEWRLLTPGSEHEVLGAGTDRLARAPTVSDVAQESHSCPCHLAAGAD